MSQGRVAKVERRVDKVELARFYATILHLLGVSDEDSRMAANVLVFADARGVHTHGAANFARIYVSQLREGAIDPAARPRVVRERAASALMDARRGLGLVSCQLAMGNAIERAKRFGVGVVAVRNSTHCGSLGYYTQQAIDEGMIGFAFTNTGSESILRPPGGGHAMLGTNVLAVAAPAAERAPFSLDMSTATVSTGRVRRAHRLGEPVPAGWLVDDEGRDVEDPAAFLEGRAHLQFLGGDLETGGYKGYGLALMIDILCGILTGSAVGPGGNPSDEDGGIGHLVIALDVDGFRERSSFSGALDEMLAAVLACPPIAAERPVSYAGCAEHEAMRQAEEGIALDEGLLRELAQLAQRFDISAPCAVDLRARAGVRE